jgi:oxygen-independent coproporphyrinogen-3 oxidase
VLIYVHVPFCARRCSYCDFAIAVRRKTPSAAFADAFEREWVLRGAHPAWHESPLVETVYFGGGTPSRLDPAALLRIVAAIAATRSIAPGAEITLEANPDDVTPERVDAWLAAGVNRVSLGAQSFDPEVLAWMHRTHTAEQAARAVRWLRKGGIGNISLDLIFALPGFLGRDWDRDLGEALALAPEHLSLYGLTVEGGTPLGKWAARGAVEPLPSESAADEYLRANAALGAAGYEHYEVSNAARPGWRAAHNAGYWRRAPFLGFGPSAHSGAGRQRWWNVREWEAYRRAGEAGEDPVAGCETLSEEQQLLERRYLGLRTDSGVVMGLVPEPFQAEWQAAGWALLEAGRVRLTPEGWLRLDALVATLPSGS